jgi:collagenase-like PrtC family protease
VVINWSPPDSESHERTQRVVERAERNGTDFWDSVPVRTTEHLENLVFGGITIVKL